MSNFQRILTKIASKPSYIKKADEKIVGFQLTPKDRRNLSILLKRHYVQFKQNITDNEMLRLYLNTQYRYENHQYELSKQKKKKETDADAQVKRMLQILDEAEIKGTSEKKKKHTSGYINLKN